ncbi:hypothetical protein [Blastococcus sp. CCUG 61487]|uniref:hypothetical protein n=1 Tax=Blastococcus sp. CCUG 61487 TaxID=1840703 RepID=UPI0010C0410C|nr:hypothetical protein [Blastococcus sp. CCUG 61487]
MSGLQISVPGHGRWLPLPLEGDVDAQASAAAADLTRGRSADETGHVAALIAGTARVVRRGVERPARLGIPTFLAWALLPVPGVLRPGPVALLRGLPLAADATDDEVVGTVVDPDGERQGDVDVGTLGTSSGRAWTVRWRPVVRGDDGERLVHEQHAVLWPDRSHDLAMVLSLYLVDLLDGAAAAAPLHELAARVRWSLS